jgi:hypothetical protein
MPLLTLGGLGFCRVADQTAGFSGTALHRSDWTNHSFQRSKLLGERHDIGAVDCELALADHVSQFDAANTEPADRNNLKLSIGWSTA